MCLFGKEQNMLGVFAKGGEGATWKDGWTNQLSFELKRQVHFVPASLPPFFFFFFYIFINSIERVRYVTVR